MSVNSFMAEFADSTRLDPANSTEAVWQDAVCFTIQPFPSHDTVRLANIRALVPFQGLGSEGLLWLTSLADRHDVSIVGEAERTGPDHPLDQAKLWAWYRRHGFSVSSRGDIEYAPRERRA